MHLYNPKLHLFVDDHAILERGNVERLIGRARKHHEPVVKQTEPWESPWLYAWGTVMDDPEMNRLRMWYGTMGHEGTLALGRTCYAESTDGIEWQKPALGRYELFGHRDTNVVAVTSAVHKPGSQGDRLLAELGVRFLGDGPGLHDFADHEDGTNVLYDPNEPDVNKRYKFVGCMWRKDDHGAHSHNYMTSPDGICWSMPPQKLMTVNDGTTVQWDPIRKRWMLGWLSSAVLETGEVIRYPELSESEDLIHWNHVGKPFEFDEADDFGKTMQGHFICPFAYGDQYLGFYSSIHTKEGWVQTYLVSSRDGRTWDRMLRRDPLIPIGGEGAFDEDSVDTAINSPIPFGDDLHIYYCGRARRHDQPLAATGAIGLVRIKRDRFAGLANGGWFNRDCNNNVSNDGHVLTRPVEVTGPTLYINARSRQVPLETQIPDVQSKGDMDEAIRQGVRWGTVRVELLDEDQRQIPGYTLDECIPVRDDAVRIPVHWQSRDHVDNLIGQQVHVRFAINMATLYAYTFDT